MKKFVFGLSAAVVAATSVAWSAGVTIEAGDVDALFEAMKSGKTPIDLKPGEYDLTKLTPQNPYEVGLAKDPGDYRTAYLLTSSGIELRGNTTKHWSEWTEGEMVVLKGNGTQRLVYPYGGGGRGATFKGIIFEDGSATNSPTQQDGGAIYFMGNSGGFATNCVFRNCSAASGGGVFCVSSKDCLFEGCMATGNGGGAYLNGDNPYNAQTNFLTGCVFLKCSANVGGAVYANEQRAIGTPRAGYIENCQFYTNSAATYGGAVLENAAGLIRNCHFEGNVAANGGAVRAYNLFSSMLSNCTFVANRAKTGKGGAVDNWQNVIGCSFSGNVAEDGGAVSSVKVLTDCGFTNNVSEAKGVGTDLDHGGGALFGSAAVTNCTFSGNVANNRGGAVCGSGTYTNCLFVGNCSTNDGGASYTGTYRACFFTNNWTVSSSGHGGANAWGTLYGCRIVGNRALNHRGGGLWHSTAYDTSFCDNKTAQSARGGAAAFSKCYDCFFTGIGEVSCGTYVGCEFSGVEAFQAQTWIFDSIQNGGENTYVTNCLVHHCKVPQLVSNNGKRMEVVNCTFADNTLTASAGVSPFAVATYRGIEYSSPVKYHVSTSVVVNCLFVNNTAAGSRVDLGVLAEDKETFEGPRCVNIVSNCMYESGCSWAGGQVGQETCFQGAARFVAGNAAYPDEPHYALRHASAARNRGINQPWMTSARDFAGRDRILDGTVDIGCCECDLPAVGAMLLLR